jgi:predicted methyltransferase
MIRQTSRSLVLTLALMVPVLPAAAQDASRSQEARRDEWQKVDEIFKAMAVAPGSVVADIGAGDGFFTSRLSKLVGTQGKVHAVDISADALRRLRARVAADALTNVDVIEGAVDDPRLPPGTLDAVLIVNAYHEMTQHQRVLAGIRSALKPGGRLVIVEPIAASRRKAERDQQARNHEIAIEYVRQDASDAGFAELLAVDPFTARPQGNDEEWLLAVSPVSEAKTSWAAPSDEWKSSSLRIPVEEFRKRMALGDVLVVDVRDPESYRNGHLPGAILLTPEELSTPAGREKLARERRLIVTYCS